MLTAKAETLLEKYLLIHALVNVKISGFFAFVLSLLTLFSKKKNIQNIHFIVVVSFISSIFSRMHTKIVYMYQSQTRQRLFSLWVTVSSFTMLDKKWTNLYFFI